MGAWAAGTVQAGRRLLIGSLAVGLLSLAAVAAAPAAGAVGEPGCSLLPTGELVRVAHAGRSYLLYVPDGLVGEEASGVPLLVAMHGHLSTASLISGYSGLQADADERGYVVAYPEAGRAWQDAAGSADIDFIRRVIYDVRRNQCVDPARVYLTGHSEGAFMAQRGACDLADVVASATGYAGWATDLNGDEACNPFRPISVGLFHGQTDGIVDIPYGRDARDKWVEVLGCPPVPQPVPVSGGVSERYTGCDGGTEVRWREYPNQSHFWPTGGRLAAMLDSMWALYDAFPFPVTECLPPDFVDVPGDHAFADGICWLVEQEITRGWADGTFRPGQAVTRQSMAAFLFRLSGAPAPGGCAQEFPDVTPGSPFFTEICWLAGEGITGGYGDGTFRPGAAVTRQAMAAFLHRFAGRPEVPADTAPPFADVPLGGTFTSEIAWIAASGVGRGFVDGTFRPAATVTRQAMAAFLRRVEPLR